MKIDDRSRKAFQADASLSNPAGNKPRYSKVGIGDKKVKKFCHGPQLGKEGPHRFAASISEISQFVKVSDGR